MLSKVIDSAESEAAEMNEEFIILDAMADDAESIVQIRKNLEYYGRRLPTERVVSLLKWLLSEGYIIVDYNDTGVFEDSWFDMTSKGRKYLNDNIDLVE